MRSCIFLSWTEQLKTGSSRLTARGRVKLPREGDQNPKRAQRSRTPQQQPQRQGWRNLVRRTAMGILR